MFARTEQSGYPARAVHVDALRGGSFRQARHREDIPRQRHDEARPGGHAQLAHSYVEILRRAELRLVVGEAVLRLCHAHGKLSEALRIERFELSARLIGEYDAAPAVYPARHGGKLFLYRVRQRVGEAEILRHRAQAHDLVCKLLSACAALGPHLAQLRVHARGAALLLHEPQLRRGVGGEAVYRHNAVQPIGVLEHVHMPHKVRQARRKRGKVFLVQRRFVRPAVHFQRAHRRHDDRRVGLQPCRAALYIQKLLRAEVRAEAGLRHSVIAQMHRHARGRDGVAPVRDVRKRPTVHKGGRALQRLHEVGLYRVLQKRRHRAHGVELRRRHGRAVIGIAHYHPRKARLQVGKRVRKAEHGHRLRRHGDVKAVVARHAVRPLPEAVADIAKLPVVHVHTAPPRHALRVYIEGVALIYMIIHHGGKQVVRRPDGVDIPGEVQVYVLHRHDLRVSAARRAALQPEHGAKRRLSHCENGVLPYPAQRVREADGRGGLALARRRRRDGRDEDELPSALRARVQQRRVYLRLIAAVLLKIPLVYPGTRGDLSNRPHPARLRDLYVRSH